MTPHDYFEQCINELKKTGKYRRFKDILRSRGSYPKAKILSDAGDADIINWCSNDYLGMGQHPVVLTAMHRALDEVGAGSGGNRNIGGTTHYHVELERTLAHLHHKESALLYTSAYVANEWSLIAFTPD